MLKRVLVWLVVAVAIARVAMLATSKAVLVWGKLEDPWKQFSAERC
jgi:hypothetical protein